MIKKIKLYFRMKSTERQMKYELLCMLYSMMSEFKDLLEIAQKTAVKTES